MIQGEKGKTTKQDVHAKTNKKNMSCHRICGVGLVTDSGCLTLALRVQHSAFPLVYHP